LVYGNVRIELEKYIFYPLNSWFKALTGHSYGNNFE